MDFILFIYAISSTRMTLNKQSNKTMQSEVEYLISYNQSDYFVIIPSQSHPNQIIQAILMNKFQNRDV